jgi:hypothetical protein
LVLKLAAPIFQAANFKVATESTFYSHQAVDGAIRKLLAIGYWLLATATGYWLLATGYRIGIDIESTFNLRLI